MFYNSFSSYFAACNARNRLNWVTNAGAFDSALGHKPNVINLQVTRFTPRKVFIHQIFIPAFHTNERFKKKIEVSITLYANKTGEENKCKQKNWINKTFSNHLKTVSFLIPIGKKYYEIFLCHMKKFCADLNCKHQIIRIYKTSVGSQIQFLF